MKKPVGQKNKSKKNVFGTSLDSTRLLIRERKRNLNLSYSKLEELAGLGSTTLSKQLSLNAVDNHKKPLSPQIVEKIAPHLGKPASYFFVKDSKRSIEQGCAIASELIFILYNEEKEEDEGELIEREDKNEIIALDDAVQNLKEVYFTLQINQCYLLTKHFSVYTLLPSEAWKFLYYFTDISPQSKVALKLILQAHLMICDNTLHKDENGIPIHTRFSPLLKELKNSILGIEIAEIQTKESLWLELNKHIATANPTYFSNDIEVVTGGLEESLTIDEYDIDMLLLFIPFYGSNYNELNNILTTMEMILRREKKQDSIW
ncbi:helix-turn-helix transcriptional regulator [Clostridium merdae]|uniref:helix-turn-helix transcriptional regulator n=1 Tax=Clostridium merdae TaxID=1958780 RepID=UPI000A267805|nr:helix-turn-helix transcriptional regulator [Clostridium merdae]